MASVRAAAAAMMMPMRVCRALCPLVMSGNPRGAGTAPGTIFYRMGCRSSSPAGRAPAPQCDWRRYDKLLTPCQACLVSCAGRRGKGGFAMLRTAFGLLGAVFAVAFSTLAAAADTPVDLELVLAVDVSRS